MATTDRGKSGVAERKMANLTDCYVGWDEDDPQAIIYDARHMKRATAIGRHASEYGYAFKDVVCRTRYARWITRQEVWDDRGRERWGDDQLDALFTGTGNDPIYRDGTWRYPDGTPVAFEPIPDAAPDDWEPREDDPAFEFCKRDDDGAIKVYVCEVEG